MRKRLLVVMVMIAAAVLPLGCAQLAAELPNAIKESSKPQVATAEKYNKLQKGMTEAEVVAIMGAKATESSELDRGPGKSESYRDWVNYDGSMIQLTFVNGELKTIHEYKVLDPNEDPLK
jgi:hypothetical protein